VLKVIFRLFCFGRRGKFECKEPLQMHKHL